MLSEREHGSPSAVSWGLNPCSNGICSQRWKITMEKGQIPYVLILVLMEYALRDLINILDIFYNPCLNPCSNGICSQSYLAGRLVNVLAVLILVLMEDALRVKK